MGVSAEAMQCLQVSREDQNKRKRLKKEQTNRQEKREHVGLEALGLILTDQNPPRVLLNCLKMYHIYAFLTVDYLF